MKINCGGFEIDENNFELDGGTLKLKNSGSGGGATIVHVELPRGAWDMTAGEAFAAAQTGLVILVESVAGEGIVGAGPIGIGIDEEYHYITTTSVSNATYGALTADDYPTVGGSSGGDVGPTS